MATPRSHSDNALTTDDRQVVGRFVESLRMDQFELQKELSQLESGRTRSGLRSGRGRWIDATAQRIQQIRREIASLEVAIEITESRAVSH
jgi:hypothetical protein